VTFQTYRANHHGKYGSFRAGGTAGQHEIRFASAIRRSAELASGHRPEGRTHVLLECGRPEDLVQEITLQLWRAFPVYDQRRRFATWMYRIALNVAISFVRRTTLRARYTAPHDQESLELIPNQGEEEPDPLLSALEAFTAELDGLNRALLVLYLEENSYKDIAEILGITETNVATKISRLKQRMRDELSHPNTNEKEQLRGAR
jgi:RNA polymerase sigma factor (sigma-70 family)